MRERRKLSLCTVENKNKDEDDDECGKASKRIQKIDEKNIDGCL